MLYTHPYITRVTHARHAPQKAHIDYRYIPLHTVTYPQNSRIDSRHIPLHTAPQNAHIYYLEWHKGREVEFSAAAGFLFKISAGAFTMMRSRVTYRYIPLYTATYR